MSTQRDLFIQTYMPQAERVAARLNVPVQGVLNHWGLETGWGKSIIPGTNNLGNIKDFSGGGVGATDNMTKARDNYRQYATPDDFADDYARLIGTNKRYASALNTNSVYDFANGLQRGGYAEDQNFARKVAGMPLNNIPAATAELNALGGLPVSRQAFYPGDANFKAQNVNKIAPEVAAELEQIRQQKMAMLPYALAHAMSSNAGSQNFGQLLTSLAMPAMDGTALKNGRITPSGQYITDQSDADQWKAYAAMMAAGAKADQAGGLPGTISQFGYTPEGQRVVTSNKRGGQFTVQTDDQGNETFTPYSGPATPSSDYEKQVKEVGKALASLDRTDALMQKVKDNPKAFSPLAAGITKLPKTMGSWTGAMLLPEDALKTRADVTRLAAMEIKELYGAALSLGEEARANQFLPASDDPPEMIMQKLAAAREWAQGLSKEYGPGVAKTARSRAGQVTNTPAVGGAQKQNDPNRRNENGVNYVKIDGQWYQE